MFKTQNSKRYDLRERTLRFAKMVRSLKNLPETLSNIEDSKQLIKASGSVEANYIEAEEALSRVLASIDRIKRRKNYGKTELD